VTEASALDQAPPHQPGGEFDPRTVEQLLADGRARLEAGDPAGAQFDFQAALAKVPGSSEVMFELARAEYRAGDPEGALARIMQAQETAPEDADVQVRRWLLKDLDFLQCRGLERFLASILQTLIYDSLASYFELGALIGSDLSGHRNEPSRTPTCWRNWPGSSPEWGCWDRAMRFRLLATDILIARRNKGRAEIGIGEIWAIKAHGAVEPPGVDGHTTLAGGCGKQGTSPPEFSRRDWPDPPTPSAWRGSDLPPLAERPGGGVRGGPATRNK
jgi:hypothetical protein